MHFQENPYHKEAKELAALLKQKITGEDGMVDDGNLLEHLHSLFFNEEKKELDETILINYQDFVTELITLLTEEDFRQRMKDSYFKNNGGKLLRRLYYFFKLLESDKFYPFLDYINLKKFSGAISAKELKKIKEKYGFE